MTPGGIGETLRTGQNLPIWRANTNIPVEDILCTNTWMVFLINMNGRVYAPVLSRFLSPDPYIQAPELSLNYNRYTYCMNNPMLYTDPSGENPFLVIGLVALFTYAKTAHDNRDPETGNWDWNLSRTFSDKGVTPFTLGFSTNSDFKIGGNVNVGGQTLYEKSMYKEPKYGKISKEIDEAFGQAGGIMYNEEVEKLRGNDQVSNWIKSSKDKQLITGRFDRYYGAGGQIKAELWGERLNIGLHLFTVRESMMNGKYTFKTGREYNMVSKYSGIEIGWGPIGINAIYDWDKGWKGTGFQFGHLSLGGHGDPSATFIGGSLYLLGGIGGSIYMNTGKFIYDASPAMIPQAEKAIPWSSDVRLKDDVKRINSSLDNVLKLNGYRYTWKENAKVIGHEGNDIGLLAQEVEKIYPEIVLSEDSSTTGYKQVYYFKFIPVLIEAIKEQQKIINGQNIIIQEFEDKIKYQDALLNKILLKLKNIEN